MTKARDALSSKRRMLPMVRVEKTYQFDGPEGVVALPDLFEGRHQLIIQHFMFDPGWEEGCPSCTAASDELSAGLLRHLQARDTTFAVVSRAPLEKLQRYKRQRGWDFNWYSSYGSDFNYDYHVTLDDSVVPFEYNYRTKAEWDLMPNNDHVQSEQPFDLHGLSCFLKVGDDIHHTYSTYGRGPDAMTFTVTALDLTAMGRQD